MLHTSLKSLERLDRVCLTVVVRFLSLANESKEEFKSHCITTNAGEMF